MANPDGTPVWFELNTPDRDTASAFYKAVAGWDISASPVPEHGGYLIATAQDGAAVAGFMTPPPGMPGVPGWTIYFGCDDVDAEAGAIKELGGAVHFGPMDIPGVGRFAVVSDPQGVTFSLMKGAGTQDSAAFHQGENSLGHGVWVELATPDPAAALGFYGKLFGWTAAGSMPMGTMGDYIFLGAGEKRPGAVMSSAATGAPARWAVYFQVGDIDAALAASTAGGGRTVQGPDPIPGGAFSARIVDPDGAGVGVVGPRRAG